MIHCIFEVHVEACYEQPHILCEDLCSKDASRKPHDENHIDHVKLVVKWENLFIFVVVDEIIVEMGTKKRYKRVDV